MHGNEASQATELQELKQDKERLQRELGTAKEELEQSKAGLEEANRKKLTPELQTALATRFAEVIKQMKAELKKEHEAAVQRLKDDHAADVKGIRARYARLFEQKNQSDLDVYQREVNEGIRKIKEEHKAEFGKCTAAKEALQAAFDAKSADLVEMTKKYQGCAFELESQKQMQEKPAEGASSSEAHDSNGADVASTRAAEEEDTPTVTNTERFTQLITELANL